MPLDITMTTEQKVRVMVAPMTAGGHPATLDGPVVLTVTAGDCLIDMIDEQSGFVVAGDAPGDSTVMVSADADLGDGVQTIEDTVMVHVLHAMAESLGLQADTPEMK